MTFPHSTRPNSFRPQGQSGLYQFGRTYFCTQPLLDCQMIVQFAIIAVVSEFRFLVINIDNQSTLTMRIKLCYCDSTV